MSDNLTPPQPDGTTDSATPQQPAFDAPAAPPAQPAFEAPVPPQPQHAQPDPQYAQQQYAQPDPSQYAQQPGQPAYGYAPPAPLDQASVAQVSLWSHVGGLLTGFVVPLILWLMFKDRSAFAGEHAKEALNFQIVVAIALFVSSLLTIAFIGFVLIPAVFVIDIIFAVQGAMAGNRLQPYRYPWTFRFIK